MRLRSCVLGALLASVVELSAAISSAASRMVGIVPSDGVAMFVKRFPVAAGTTILGIEFMNNDSRTVFPEVLLVRGGETTIVDGTIVARATSVSETMAGSVRVLWAAPVQVARTENYYAAVRIPEGAGKQGPGNGPALGAMDVSGPKGSFLASGSEGVLTPIGVDLAMSLLTTGIGKASAPPPTEPEAISLRTFLGHSAPNPAPLLMRIEFGVERAMHVSLSIYDVSGREVRRLADGTIAGGVYSRDWDGRDSRGKNVAAGVYIAKLQAGEKILTQKVVLAR